MKEIQVIPGVKILFDFESIQTESELEDAMTYSLQILKYKDKLKGAMSFTSDTNIIRGDKHSFDVRYEECFEMLMSKQKKVSKLEFNEFVVEKNPNKQISIEISNAWLYRQKSTGKIDTIVEDGEKYYCELIEKRSD